MTQSQKLRAGGTEVRMRDAGLEKQAATGLCNLAQRPSGMMCVRRTAQAETPTSSPAAGAPGKGLPLGTGPGEGAWRLELTAPADAVGLAYLRHLDDGFVTGMNALAPVVDGAYRVDLLNPASTWLQASLLRFDQRRRGAESRVTDDTGEPGSAPVSLAPANPESDAP